MPGRTSDLPAHPISSAKALGGDFRSCCDAADLPKRCSLHGLRKGNLRRHADAGATTKELQALGGHKSLSALQPYIDAADKARLAVQAMAKFKRATQRASENKKPKNCPACRPALSSNVDLKEEMVVTGDPGRCVTNKRYQWLELSKGHKGAN